MLNKYLVLPLLLCSNFALANEHSSPEQGFYLGAYIGESSFDVSKSDFEAEQSAKLDKSGTAFKLAAGYQFSKYFAVEFGYADLGEFTLSDSYDVSNSLGDFSGSMNMSGSIEALTVALIGIFPINEQYNLYAKVGVAEWDANFNASAERNHEYSDAQYSYLNGADSYANSVSDSDNDIFYGAGFSYNLSPFLLHAEYEIYDTDGEKTSLLSLGATYHF